MRYLKRALAYLLPCCIVGAALLAYTLLYRVLA